MALSKLESLPAEVRIRIFEFVFEGSRVSVKWSGEWAEDPWSEKNYEADAGILFTSKLLYPDARDALARSLKLCLHNVGPSDLCIPESTRVFYSPLIRHLEIGLGRAWYRPTPPYDFNVLQNLKSLRLGAHPAESRVSVVIRSSHKVYKLCQSGQVDYILKTV
jgi:hypothetical protein